MAFGYILSRKPFSFHSHLDEMNRNEKRCAFLSSGCDLPLLVDQVGDSTNQYIGEYHNPRESWSRPGRCWLLLRFVCQCLGLMVRKEMNGINKTSDVDNVSPGAHSIANT